MRLSELEATRGWCCKEHPNDKQLPGVCSSCLRDKLSQLYHKNPIDPFHYCSPSPSSPASPVATDDASSSNHGSSAHHRRRFRRNGSYATGSASCMHGLNLKKSRSLAFAYRLKERDGSSGGERRGRKKDGFWSKVLKLTRKDTEESVVKSRA